MKRIGLVLFGLVCLGLLVGCTDSFSSLYTVTYNDNGATGASAPTDSKEYQEGAAITA